MQYDLFISYARADNRNGQVRELRNALTENFRNFAGRDLKVFFDEECILSMDAWEKRIASGLAGSELFVAVLSPQFFASEYCRREWQDYVRYEAMRHCLGDGIAPVYFVELPGLDVQWHEHGIVTAVKDMRRRQWCDLRPWHDFGRRALENAEVAARLDTLKEQIAERLTRADRTRKSPTNLCRHNPHFVGRVHELSLLREALVERGCVGVVGQADRPAVGTTTVHGIGGMGKTELALAYAHAFGWDYPGGRWMLRCEHLTSFDQALGQLADPLGISFTETEQKNPSQAAERVLSELRRRKRTLLLLDNVANTSLVGPDMVMRLPPAQQLHLVATTRLGPAQIGGSSQDHTFVAIDKLPEEDAFSLIRAHQPNAQFATLEDETAARKLVKLLDGFTLAVETAAIYLGRHATIGAIPAYIDRLREPGELLSSSEAAAGDPVVAVRHRERLLTRTLDITLLTLKHEEVFALTAAAQLPPDLIPLPWLAQTAADLLDGFSDEGAWRPVTDALLSLRLLHAGNDSRLVRMHRLVQELIRSKGHLEEAPINERLQQAACCAMNRLWDDWSDPNARWEIDAIMTAAAVWLEQGSKKAAALAGQIAEPLLRLGRWDEGIGLARAGLEATRRNPTAPFNELATSENQLAQLLKESGDYSEAEALYRMALDRFDDQAKLMKAEFYRTFLDNLADLLRRTGRLEEAGQLQQELQAQGPSENLELVAREMSNLATTKLQEKNFNEARKLFEEALSISRRELPHDHPTLAIRLSNLGLVYLELNQLEEAERYFSEALAIEKANLDPDNVQLASSYSNLSNLYLKLGRLREAEKAARNAITIDERVHGSDHIAVAYDLAALANVLLTLNRPEEAEAIMRRHLVIFFCEKIRIGRSPLYFEDAIVNYVRTLHALGLDNGAVHAKLESVKNDAFGNAGAGNSS